MGYADPLQEAAYKRRHYQENKALYKARARAHTRRQRKRLKEIIGAAKAVPCADCGHTFPSVCMDFDHGGSDKDGAVADLVSRGASIARLRAEIAKCEVVCANCHRIRTAREREKERTKMAELDTGGIAAEHGLTELAAGSPPATPQADEPEAPEGEQEDASE